MMVFLNFKIYKPLERNEKSVWFRFSPYQTIRPKELIKKQGSIPKLFVIEILFEKGFGKHVIFFQF